MNNNNNYEEEEGPVQTPDTFLSVTSDRTLTHPENRRSHFKTPAPILPSSFSQGPITIRVKSIIVSRQIEELYAQKKTSGIFSLILHETVSRSHDPSHLDKVIAYFSLDENWKWNQMPRANSCFFDDITRIQKIIHYPLPQEFTFSIGDHQGNEINLTEGCQSIVNLSILSMNASEFNMICTSRESESTYVNNTPQKFSVYRPYPVVLDDFKNWGVGISKIIFQPETMPWNEITPKICIAEKGSAPCDLKGSVDGHVHINCPISYPPELFDREPLIRYILRMVFEKMLRATTFFRKYVSPTMTHGVDRNYISSESVLRFTVDESKINITLNRSAEKLLNPIKRKIDSNPNYTVYEVNNINIEALFPSQLYLKSDLINNQAIGIEGQQQLMEVIPTAHFIAGAALAENATPEEQEVLAPIIEESDPQPFPATELNTLIPPTTPTLEQWMQYFSVGYLLSMFPPETLLAHDAAQLGPEPRSQSSRKRLREARAVDDISDQEYGGGGATTAAEDDTVGTVSGATATPENDVGGAVGGETGTGGIRAKRPRLDGHDGDDSNPPADTPRSRKKRAADDDSDEEYGLFPSETETETEDEDTSGAFGGEMEIAVPTPEDDMAGITGATASGARPRRPNRADMATAIQKNMSITYVPNIVSYHPLSKSVINNFKFIFSDTPAGETPITHLSPLKKLHNDEIVVILAFKKFV